MVTRAFLDVRRRSARALAERSGCSPHDLPELRVRPVPTVLIGALGGLAVGMTSVGSGSLIIVMLLLLHPSLKASQLVGHRPRPGHPASRLRRSRPHPVRGLRAGAHDLVAGGQPARRLPRGPVSAQAPGGLIRRALALVLTASALKLLGMGTGQLGRSLAIGVIAGPLVWRRVRATGGLSRPPARPLIVSN